MKFHRKELQAVYRQYGIGLVVNGVNNFLWTGLLVNQELAVCFKVLTQFHTDIPRRRGRQPQRVKNRKM